MRKQKKRASRREIISGTQAPQGPLQGAQELWSIINGLTLQERRPDQLTAHERRVVLDSRHTAEYPPGEDLARAFAKLRVARLGRDDDAGPRDHSAAGFIVNTMPDFRVWLDHGKHFSSGGLSKKGNVYEPKKSIQRICECICSLRLDDVVAFLADEDRCADLFSSTTKPINIQVLVCRGESAEKPRHISFRRLRNILTELRNNR
jgi:hypothetical protein